MKMARAESDGALGLDGLQWMGGHNNPPKTILGDRV
jgi:hypothetical protein